MEAKEQRNRRDIREEYQEQHNRNIKVKKVILRVVVIVITLEDLLQELKTVIWYHAIF